MNLKDIEDKINEKFKDCEDRKIVVWYDKKPDFLDEIENINLENAQLYIFKDDNPIYTKIYIEHDHPDENFLLYIPSEQLSDTKNYLADIVYYADEFTADKIAILCQDLGVDSSFYRILDKYSNFFNANDRIDKFKSLHIDYTEENIILGILAVITKQDSLNINYILREVLVNELNGKKNILDQFIKYNILDDFWNIISKTFNYRKDDPSIEDLMIFLLINYSASLFDSNTPKSWNQYIVDDKKNARIFIDEFMNNNNYADDYNQIADRIEEKINVRNSIKNMLVESYIKCDTFRIFDRKILYYYVDLLESNKNPINLDFLDYRKNTHFYSDFENEYNLLFWANTFFKHFNNFEANYVSNDADGIIDQFIKIGVYTDMSYRKFYYYYDKIDDTDYIKDLRQLIENMYNTYLNKINPDYSKAITQLDSINDINISKQWNFYRENGLKHVQNKTVVFISDALRYGCALELKEEFDKDPKRKASITPMHSTIPSYTSLGMASLLPNKKISYDNSTVLVDGKRVKSTQERRSHLEDNFPDSALYQYDELKNFKQDELRSKLKNKKLLYIYHNQIDARGDHAATENEVFNASQESIDEIVKMVNKLRNSAGFGTFYITSDHGFIYKTDALKEYDKISLPKQEDIIHNNRRFILTDYKTDIDQTYCLSLDYMGIDDIYVTIPKGIEVFKIKGSGVNFVHGGASLEECITPLLKVEAQTGAKNQNKVELQLSSNTRISNHISKLTFTQRENISEKVLPLIANIFFVDEDNHRISNEVLISADVNSDKPQDRQFMREFTFKDIDYSKEDYYLVINDFESDEEIERIPFYIDIAF